MSEPLALVAVLVLAGGASTRMGTDKASLEFRDETLLARAVRRLQPLNVPLHVLSGVGQAAPVPGDLRAQFHYDEAAHQGPLVALSRVLAGQAAGYVAVVAVDLPFVNAGVLRQLAAAAGAGDCDGAAPMVEGHPQVLHAVYHTRLAPGMQAAVAAGERSLRRFLAGQHIAWMEPARLPGLDPTLPFWFAVNTPAELAAAERLAAQVEGGL